MVQRSGTEPVTSGLRRVVAASMAGTVVEWYEFFLYATAANLVFGKMFFPNAHSELDGIMDAFLTYAVGFVARPLGGLVFGHFGDKLGRKKLLQLSIILVGASTFLMGCLPGFAEWGYLAPLALVTLRFIQGFAVGGEWGGAALLVAEHSPNRSRGFWASWPQTGVPLGNLLATAVLLILSATVSQEDFLAWGWRIGFWLSAVIVVVGYYIRTKISDAPIFLEAAQEQEEAAGPSGVLEVVRRYPRRVLAAMGVRFAENVIYYLVVTFSITYLKVILHMDTSHVLLLLLVAHAIHCFMVPAAGKLLDAWGRKPTYLLGAVVGAFWGFAAFPMMDSRQDGLILAAIVLGLASHALMYAGQPSIMAEMFPTSMRYSGLSIGSQVTSVLSGSLAPIIATALLGAFGSSVPIALYLLASCVVTIIAVLALKETKGIDLRELDAAHAARMAAADGRAAGRGGSALQDLPTR